MFDTLDHNILLRKLFYYGLRDNNLKLLQSYLQDKKEYSAYQNSSKSKYNNVIVLQGSILGPLLFLIFIIDLWHSTPFKKTILFSTGTNLFIYTIMLKSYLELWMLC